MVGERKDCGQEDVMMEEALLNRDSSVQEKGS